MKVFLILAKEILNHFFAETFQIAKYNYNLHQEMIQNQMYMYRMNTEGVNSRIYHLFCA